MTRKTDKQQPATATVNAVAQLMTIDSFRRRFFEQKDRPSRRRVVHWILLGTVEGVRLPARKIDERYYLDPVEAERFLENTRVARDVKLPTAAEQAIERRRTEAVLERLRTVHGIKC